MESKLGRLSPQRSKASTPKEAVADSWEDDTFSDSSLKDESQPRSHSTTRRDANRASKPPETSSTPQMWPQMPIASDRSPPDWDTSRSSEFREERRRPEKSTAVAGRMIAGALGVKAAKKTEEQQAYERSIKEQELRRRNREKELREKEKMEVEKAKVSVWDE